jgi:5-methylthioribose kinase
MAKEQKQPATISWIGQYLKDHKLFPQSCTLSVEDLHNVKESAEGFMNELFRVSGSNGRSVVVKRVCAIPISRTDSPEDRAKPPIDPTRIRNENAVLIFWNQVSPGICPEIYLYDEPLGITVMEDLSALKMLRHENSRMHQYPMLASRMGRFFARNLFDSSALNMTRYRFEKLCRYFENGAYDTLFFSVFQSNSVVTLGRPMQLETRPLRQRIIDNPTIQQKIKRLADRFLNAKECLIHTDIHASNIMVDAEHIKVIDTEFAGFGPIAQDLGRFTASFVLNYLSWYGDRQADSKDVSAFQDYLISQMIALYDSFDQTFRQLVEANMAINYPLQHLDVDHYLLAHFKEALLFTAINAASRLPDPALCHDLKRLGENRLYPTLLMLTIFEDLFTNRIAPPNMAAFTHYLKTLTVHHPRSAFQL